MSLENEPAEGYVPDEGIRQNPRSTSDVETGNSPEKEFRMIVNMIQELRKRMGAQRSYKKF